MWVAHPVLIMMSLIYLDLVNLVASAALTPPKVILVSMDGFRYDYLSQASTPNFDKVREAGITMPYINNTFVTLTFPCHNSIATGRYEESHGIIANNMYDPQFDSHFTQSTKESRWWEGAEPIWVTAKKAGLNVGVYFWPGNEAEIFGFRPDQWLRYNSSVPYEERVETVIRWMSDDDFDLGLLYFEEPDHTGHNHGPESNETMMAVERMDAILGLLLQRIEDTGLKDVMNLIVTSDHGMASVDTLNRLIDVSDYANSTLLLEVVEQGGTAHLRPQPGKAQELVDALANVPHMTVMLKDDIPERFHFRDHRRVTPVFAMAEEGWEITGDAAVKRLHPYLGGHGYDDALMSMKPIFVASGPAFKSGERVEPIESVDIYPLICHLLNISPAPNNGSLARAAPMLQNIPEGTIVG